MTTYTRKTLSRRPRRITVGLAATAASLAAMMLALGGCAFYRSGVYSRPYVGDAPPPEPQGGILSGRDAVVTVELSDLTVDVQLRNGEQTFEALWFGIELPVLPLWMSWKHQTKIDPAGEYHAAVILKPGSVPVRFTPSAALLSVDGSSYPVVRALTRDYPWELEHQDVSGQTQNLEPTVRRTRYELFFACPEPSPSQAIALDLSTALRRGADRPGPLIRFQKTRWSEWEG